MTIKLFRMNFCIKLIVILGLFSLSFLSLKCSVVQNDITGVWQLINSGDCNRNFLELSPFIDPYAKYGHKIYVSDSLFYNPWMREEGLPFERRYKVKDKQIFLNGIGQILFTREDSILVLEKEGCKLTFIKKADVETLSEYSLANITFYVKDNDGSLVDSLNLQRTTSNAHIFRLAASIEIENLDKVFDEGVSDTNEYKIILQLRNGKSFRITSYGKYETPFEVQTLIKYLLREN